MKPSIVITVGTFLLLVIGIFTATQTLAAEVKDKGNSVEFRGLAQSDIKEVRRALETSVNRTVNNLSAGDVSKEKKDCKRIDLTDKQICVEITIETIPD